MQSIKSKFGIIITLLVCALFISTCKVKQSSNICCPELQHEAQINQLKKEKAEQQVKYERQITSLQAQKDTLQKVICNYQEILAKKQQKIACLERELKASVKQVRRFSKFADSLRRNIADCTTLHVKQEECYKEKIQGLEQLVAKRDSTIVIYKQVIDNLRDLHREQALRIQYLTSKLHTVYIVQKYKIKQKLSVRRIIVNPGFFSLPVQIVK